MTLQSSPPLLDELRSLTAWWRDAGVDWHFEDMPTRWLEKPEAEPAPSASHLNTVPPAPRVIEHSAPSVFGGPKSSWPNHLEEFRTWWMEQASLEDGGTGPRVAPHGPSAAKLMVLVACPEQNDTEQLLSGPAGRLVSSFLQAAGIDRDTVYFASCLPRFSALPNLKRNGLAALTRHHVGLAAPARILLFGRNILPLFAHEPAQPTAHLREFNHDGRTIPLLNAPGPAELLSSAKARAALWTGWLDWTYG